MTNSIRLVVKCLMSYACLQRANRSCNKNLRNIPQYSAIFHSRNSEVRGHAPLKVETFKKQMFFAQPKLKFSGHSICQGLCTCSLEEFSDFRNFRMSVNGYLFGHL